MVKGMKSFEMLEIWNVAVCRFKEANIYLVKAFMVLKRGTTPPITPLSSTEIFRKNFSFYFWFLIWSISQKD